MFLLTCTFTLFVDCAHLPAAYAGIAAPVQTVLIRCLWLQIQFRCMSQAVKCIMLDIDKAQEVGTGFPKVFPF